MKECELVVAGDCTKDVNANSQIYGLMASDNKPTIAWEGGCKNN